MNESNEPQPKATPATSVPPGDEGPSLGRRVHRALVGAPKDLRDRGIFHALSLVPFLAWVGLGADGLSSSAYGPEEAYRALHEHRYLAVLVALAMAATVAIISIAYSRIIEAFPHGGGGYVVASKTLGQYAGLVSGSALLVDYVLTITVSVAAAGDALFSFLPMGFIAWKLPCEILTVSGLTVLNVRGVKESVVALTPMFLLFLITHVVLLGGAVLHAAPVIHEVTHETAAGFRSGLATLGVAGMLKLFVHAYSLGGGTYTGIEAVSNGLPIMREPRVKTAQTTMVYMAASLAFTAAGLLLAYLVFHVEPVEGKTMNAALLEQFAGTSTAGRTFTIVALVSEGALLIVAAQAGFVDGPRVMANMATDSWMPHRLAALSDRLTTQNGVVLMGLASISALVYSRGSVSTLVVMYSINVFLTFSLSMFGMVRRGGKGRGFFVLGFAICATILGVTVHEKFLEGRWITLVVTGALVGLCFVIRRHYEGVSGHFERLNEALADLRSTHTGPPPGIAKNAPTAVVLVTSYSGVGIHTLLNVFRAFAGYYRNFVFVSVGVIDSGGFKGESELAALETSTEGGLKRYVETAHALGVAATYRYAIGTEAVDSAEALCISVAREFPRCTFFAGQVVFQRERWYDPILHNQTAFAIQKRLQWEGMTMVIMPVRVR